ncbi:MAG: MauE/DoxX family redox-associated membrane protein [Elusimicrobiota bacterium]
MSKQRKKNEPPSSPAWDIPGAAARTLLAAVFLVSGLQKAAAPAEEFAVIIEAYHLISPEMALNMARALPPVEILLGLALLGGYLCRLSAATAGALFLMFIGALASTLVRGVPLESCGCFGGFHLTPAQALTLDSVLLCLAYLAYRKGSAYAPIGSWIQRGKEDTGHA